jgi:hypothetical protein
MRLKFILLLVFTTIASSHSKDLQKKKDLDLRHEIEKNPRNRTFSESFQSLHSFGIMEKQEVKKDEKSKETQTQKASP